MYVVDREITITTESDETVEIVCQSTQFLDVTSGRLTLKNVHIRGGTISVQDAVVVIEDCVLEDVSILPTSSKTVTLTVRRSHFQGTVTCDAGTTCFASSLVQFVDGLVSRLVVIVEESYLEGSLWVLRGTEYLQVTMTDVILTGLTTDSGPTNNVKHGVNLILPNGESDIYITNCTFHDILYFDQVVIGISNHAALSIAELDKRTENASAYIIIAETTFFGNARALSTRITNNLEMYILFCHFENNISQGWGAAIHLTNGDFTKVERVFGLVSIVGTDLEIGVVDSTIISNRAETYNEFSGSGGGIYADYQGSLTVVDCIMFNNSAEDSGGSIFSGYLTSATVKGVILENSAEGKHAF